MTPNPKFPWACCLLLAATLVVHAYAWANGWAETDLAWTFTARLEEPLALLWPVAHTSPVHLWGNVTLLLAAGVPLERKVGALRATAAFVAGTHLGLLAHAALPGDAPLLGASAGLAALVAYNLAVGWDRPWQSRTGRPLLWPSHVFWLWVSFEIVALLVAVGPAQLAYGAGAHLGGAAAGVVACGVWHGRWPAAAGSTRPLRTVGLADVPAGAVASQPSGTLVATTPR
jgi:membrane associated rhomboid family serine protease